MGNVASDIAHLMRRAGFGATPAEIEAGASAGYAATIERLLAGTGHAPDPLGDQVRVPALTAYYQVPANASSAERQAAAEARLATLEAEILPLEEWWLDRMIVTSTPLREKMTLLWHGHFATAISKVGDPRLMYLQNQLFRTMGTGDFGALTQAVAKGGAMMLWLDTGSDKRTHPNENFARELMELFTLGVGNYSQTDVEQAARCFTGWSYDRTTDTWKVEPGQQDDGVKTLLGVTGDLSGEEAIAVILARPECSRFVTAKVWSHLAYPVAPTDPVVTDLVAAYGRSYDLTALLRAVFSHPAFLSPAARTGLVKQPIEYLVGAARALGLDARCQRLDPATGLPAATPPTGAPRRSLASAASELAQTPFNPPNVGGWPQNDYWLNTATALARNDIAGILVHQADLSPVTEASVSQRPAAAARLLGLTDGWGPTTAALLASVADQPNVLMMSALVSPEYVLN